MLWMLVYDWWHDAAVAVVAISVSAMRSLHRLRLHPMMAWMLSQERMNSLAMLLMVIVLQVDVDDDSLQMLLLSALLTKKKRHDWHDVVEVVPFLHLP